MSDSHLEYILEAGLRDAGIDYEPQCQAIPGRLYRWDFRVRDYLIEVQGGIWHKGGHSTGTGITRDCEKANLATLYHYKTLFFTGDMVIDGRALDIIKEAIGD